MDPLESCPPHTAIGPNGYCCTGAYIRKFTANYITPYTTILGISLSAVSFVFLNKIVVMPSKYSSSKIIVQWKFRKPAHFMLKLISMNCLFYFLTCIPLIIYTCDDHTGLICGPRRGPTGYALAHLVVQLSCLGSETAHWTSYMLVIFYGVERCFLLKGNQCFSLSTGMYCYFLALQFGYTRGQMVAWKFIVRKNPINQVWYVSGRNNYGSDPFQLQLFAPSAGLFNHFYYGLSISTAICCYGYVIHWLLTHRTNRPR